MNNILTKTVKDRFVAVSHNTILALAKLNCLPCYSLYFYLADKQTFRNGLVGVFDELTIYDVSKFLSEILGKKIDTTTAKYYLKKLQSNSLIKIHNDKPLIILLTQAELAEHLATLEDVLKYVANNPNEFNFHIHIKRANTFYDFFKIVRPATPQPAPKDKLVALDTIIKNRPTRISTTEDKKLSDEWKAEIDNSDDPFNEDEDPFLAHIKESEQIVKEYQKQQEKETV